jgi:predicted nucleic acid-binding protein
LPLYLADASIWIAARRWRDSYLPALLAERLGRAEVATSAPIALEVLVGAPDAAELERDWEIWRELVWLPLGERIADRAVELMRALARTTSGAHRSRPSDYVVVACAEAAGGDLVLWHWDRDLTAICDYAGIPHEPEHERARVHGLGPEPGVTPPRRR